MLSKPSLPIGIFHSIIGMLKGLIPKKTRLPCILGGLVLSATIVSPIGCVAFWEEREMEKERMYVGLVFVLSSPSTPYPTDHVSCIVCWLGFKLSLSLTSIQEIMMSLL